MPLLALLPTQRKPGDLRALGATLHARFESVQARKDQLENEGGESERKRVAAAEYSMLSQALDWLARTGQ